MRRPLAFPTLAALGTVLAVLGAADPRPHAQTPETQRSVFVSVLDGDGAPVADLTAADFSVREDGRARPVVDAAPAAAPLLIALLLDDSGLGLRSIREGAAAFVTRLQGRAAIALITTGGRNIKLLDFTGSTAELMGGINKVYARNVTGAFLTDGIAEIARGFARIEAVRPVIVSVGVEGVDFSDVHPDDVLAALQQSRTKLYMIRLGRPVIGQSNPREALSGESFADEQTRFNAILGRAPARTGGRIEQLAIHTGIPRMMAQFAGELASQYEVTYLTVHPDGVDRRLEVATSRPGLRLRAPQRAGWGR